MPIYKQSEDCCVTCCCNPVTFFQVLAGMRPTAKHKSLKIGASLEQTLNILLSDFQVKEYYRIVHTHVKSNR